MCNRHRVFPALTTSLDKPNMLRMWASLLLAGQAISHYRILEQIGAGGMGVVYLARDERLDRDVALKVLPPRSLSDPATRRHLRKEALILSKLNHPNIAIVFDFDTENQIDFLVTEYVPGLTLDTKLAGGRMVESEVLRLGVQLASGLDAAHRQGIVHRDLKPGNLRITPDERLKILDFGLARLVPHSSHSGVTETITKSQEISGTLPYMAPEQLRGEPPDVRSDIWASGAVLYEMATGARSFPQSQPATLLHEILNSNPRPAREVNRRLSAGFEAIVSKALEKNPADRYQTARELSHDLERLIAGARPESAKPRRRPLPLLWAGIFLVAVALLVAGFLKRKATMRARVNGRRTVAILGFRNLNHDPADAWISYAVLCLIKKELAATGQLRTISEENVARMKADLSLPDSESLAPETLAKVESTLGTDLVVLGSYLNVGGQIRVDLRVQDTASGEVVAMAPAQGSSAQFLELVKQAGESLRKSCGARPLTNDERAAAEALDPANSDAVRFYSEGLAKMRDFDFLGARDLLKRTIEVDPKYPMAHSALASIWSQLGYDEKANEEAKKAFEMSDNLPRKDKISVEAAYRKQNHEWGKAVDLYHSLWTFFPDDLDYGLELVDAQVAAAKGPEAFATIEALRSPSTRFHEDPRIDMAEAAAAEAVSDYKREQSATARVIQKAERQGSRLLGAQALLRQCWALRNTGELESAKSAGLRSKDVLATIGDLRGEARSLTCVANVLQDQGDLAEAKAMHENALILAQKIGSQKDIAGALINIGNVLALQQNLEGSTGRYKQALAVSLKINDKPDAQMARNNIGANLIEECDFKQARAILLDALGTARDIGDESGVINALANLGVVSLYQGDFVGASKNLQEGLDKARRLELKNAIAAILVYVGDVKLTRDDVVEAERSYQESLVIRSALGQRGDIASSELSLGNLKLEMNQPEEAVKLSRKAAEEFRAEKMADQEALALTIAAEALLLEMRTSEAEVQLEQARQLSVQDRTVMLALEIASARLASSTGKTDEAIRQLRGTISRAQQMSLPGYAFRARLAVAEAQMSAGFRKQTFEALGRLKQDAMQAGFRLIAKKVQHAEDSLRELEN